MKMNIAIDLSLPLWAKWTSAGVALVVVGLAVRAAAGAGTGAMSFSEGETLSAAKLNDAIGAAVPTGTVIASFSPTAPSGWLRADGAPIDAATTPQHAALVNLMRSLGPSYQGVASSQAYLPDLRGRFLRGFDPDALRDPQGKTRPFGSVQLDALQNHAHPQWRRGGILRRR